MAIEAPYSSYRKTNCLIYIVVAILIGAWCAYDGYFNEVWIEDNTNNDGSPQAYLTINRQAPYYLGGVAVLCGAFWLTVRNKKITADENEIVIDKTEKIPYNAIEAIDKTYYDKKGFFIIHYKKPDGNTILKAISHKKWDKTKVLLEHLVTKIS